MSLKHTNRLPFQDQRTSSRCVQPGFDFKATKESAERSTTARQFSLHAHPRQAYHLQHLSGQHQLSSVIPFAGLDNHPRTALPGRRLHGNAALQPSKLRRTQVTSQGTVIIKRKPQGHRVQRRSVSFADAAAVDDLRSQAERGYYEQQDGEGIVRRRSMLRAVSKEDYLLGRGANPRTGLITPGGGSIDSNIDEADIPLERDRTPSAKWRQQGDQWVSLDVDEPTPLEEPPVEPSLALPKTQTPPAAQRHGKWSSERLRKASHREPKPNAGTAALKSGGPQSPAAKVDYSETVPGGHLGTPVKHPIQDQTTPQSKDKMIRRKPVGESPLKDRLRIGHLFPPKQNNTRSTTPPRLLCQEDRSFSAPLLHSQQFSPNDGGMILSTTPTRGHKQNAPATVRDDGHQIKPFLGVRSQTLGNLSQPTGKCQVLPGVNLNKELPCLPTSNGPYPLSRSETDIMTTAHPTPTRNGRPIKIDSPEQGEKLASAASASRRSHIAAMVVPPEQNIQSKKSEWTMNQDICAVPNYDNPPRNHMLGPRTPILEGPRSMPKTSHSRAQRPALNDVFTDQFSITSMSTDTFIPMLNDRTLRQQLNKRSPPKTRPPPSIPLPPIPQPRVNHRNAFAAEFATTGSQNIANISPPRMVPRGMTRPNMPSRAIGLRQIPLVEELRDVSSKTCMDVHSQSSLIGTPINGKQVKSSSDLLEEMQPIQQQPRNALVENINVKEQTNTQFWCSGQTRRCSRCQDGLVADLHHNTDGQTDIAQRGRLSTMSANAPEALDSVCVPAPISEVEQPLSLKSSFSTSQSDVSATVLDVDKDLRDHSICCPDCCKLDCHEACLGHPSPSLSATQVVVKDEMNMLRRMDSSSTLVSTSGGSTASVDGEEPKNKTSFIRSTFKVPFWHKKPTNSSHKTSDDSLVRQSLRTRPIDRPIIKTTIVKPKGGDGSHDSAVAAAKKAIGVGSVSSSVEKDRNELVIPKKRPKQKKVLNLNITQSDKTKESSLSPTPKLSIAANECRKISSSRPCSGSQSTMFLHPSQSRTISSGSTDIRFLSVDSMGLGDLSQLLFVVPFEAIRMWLYNNPQILSMGKSALEMTWSMGCEVAVTAQLLLNTVYVYSKTGKLKIKDANGEKFSPWQLMADSLKSFLYLLIFTSLSIMMMRLIKVLFLPLRLLVSLCRCLVLGWTQDGSQMN